MNDSLRQGFGEFQDWRKLTAGVVSTQTLWTCNFLSMFKLPSFPHNKGKACHVLEVTDFLAWFLSMNKRFPFDS